MNPTPAAANGPRVSVAMIVKNEEVLLEKCLKSVQDLDEIVVLDTGSQDRTVEIARRYTDKVYQDYIWNDDFSEARNQAKSRCSGDWILSIDADEELEPGGAAKIRQAIQTARKVVYLKMCSGDNVHYFPRLFRNLPEIKWVGAAHECINLVDDNRGDIVINYGYSPSHQQDPDLILRILKKEVEKNPSLVRERYYLGREYSYRRDWAPAIYHLEQYVQVASWNPEWAEGYYQLAKCYWSAGRIEDARRACLLALKINADFKSACLLMADLTEGRNRQRWLDFAAGAANADVLFTVS
ncbi:MAG: glycosyltransferase [Thermodesulfobacteriota bacterium]